MKSKAMAIKIPVQEWVEPQIIRITIRHQTPVQAALARALKPVLYWPPRRPHALLDISSLWDNWDSRGL